MTAARRRLLWFFGAAGCLLAAFCFHQEETLRSTQFDLCRLEDFDVIRTAGQTLGSKAVRLFGKRSPEPWTHIGILKKEEDGWFVLHATPNGTPQNGIRYDALQTFLDLGRSAKASVLRLSPMTAEKRAALQRNFEKWRREKVPFDYDFDNQSNQRVYCTELALLVFDMEPARPDEPVPPAFFKGHPGFCTVETVPFD